MGMLMEGNAVKERYVFEKGIEIRSGAILGMPGILMGKSTSKRQSFALEDGLALFLRSAYGGADDVHGVMVDMDSVGDASACKYAFAAKGVLTSGIITEMWGAHIRTQLSGGQATGQFGAATFEAVVDAGIANMPSGGVIQLVSWVNGTLGGSYGFINLRDYGTNPCLYFIFSPDNLLGDTKILRTNTHAPTHGLRIMVNSVAYDICLTDTHT